MAQIVQNKLLWEMKRSLIVVQSFKDTNETTHNATEN